jgi:hypothetical protein
MYLAECSPVSIRGRLVSTNIAMVACGQFVASIVDGVFGADEKNGWRLVDSLQIVITENKDIIKTSKNDIYFIVEIKCIKRNNIFAIL